MLRVWVGELRAGGEGKHASWRRNEVARAASLAPLSPVLRPWQGVTSEREKPALVWKDPGLGEKGFHHGKTE